MGLQLLERLNDFDNLVKEFVSKEYIVADNYNSSDYYQAYITKHKKDCISYECDHKRNYIRLNY